MYKIYTKEPGMPIRYTSKLLLIMRLTTLLLIMTLLQVSAASVAQKVSLNKTNASLKSVLRDIRKQSGYDFIVTESVLAIAKPVSINIKETDVRDALNQLFANQELTYSIYKTTITIKQTQPTTFERVMRAFEAIDITGQVVGEDGLPLAGATVIVKGGSNSTITDISGHFSLRKVDKDAFLTITFIGYEKKDIKVQSDLGIITLKASQSKLDEVQVIAYGTTTKLLNIGSIGTVKAAEIGQQIVQNPLSALQGRVAGTIVTQTDGLTGSSVKINIRNAGSLANGSGTNPLFVIDGVPFGITDASSSSGISGSNLNSYGLASAAGALSPFSFLNPDDIDRIDVLKDADATAIYGSRGANGVILITTKKAKSGDTKVSFNFYQGIGKVPKFLDLLNTQQYLDLRHDAFKNDGLTPSAGANPDLSTWGSTSYTDWQRKYLGGTANYTDGQFSIGGGNKLTRFLFGTSYHRETTVYPGSNQDQKITGRINLNHNSSDNKFSLNLNASYAYDQSNLIAKDLSTLYNLPPNMPIYNSDGSLYWDPTRTFSNPEAYLNQPYLGKDNTLLSNLDLGYEVITGLKVKTSIGFTNVNFNQSQQLPAVTQNPLNSPTNNANFAYLSQSSINIEPQITYDRKISKGDLSLLAGGTILRSLNQVQSWAATNYPNAALMTTPAGAANYSLSTAQYTLYKYLSFFGRTTYNWEEKYLFNATFRRDGSSRFGEGHRFGNFGSIGTAWVFSNENWLKTDSRLFSFGKLKANYGITGNDQFGDYLFQGKYTSITGNSGYQGNAAIYPSSLPNPDLHWQNIKKLDFGLELGFLSDRIHFNSSYYINKSDNDVNNLSLPLTTGFSSYFGNLPVLVQSKGVELELNTLNLKGTNFNWSTSINLTFSSNKILSFDPSYFFATTTLVNYPSDQILKYDYLYLNPQTGVPVYYSATSATGTTTLPNSTTDRTKVLSLLPTVYGGMNNQLSYKNWSFNFFIRYSKQDGPLYPITQPGIFSSGNFPTYVLNRWKNPGDQTSVPKASTLSTLYSSYYGNSDAIYGDNSYLKLQNINLSYTVPIEIKKRIRMSDLKIYLQGQNIYTWTKNKTVYDPSNGVGTAYPILRVISIGVNGTF